MQFKSVEVSQSQWNQSFLPIDLGCDVIYLSFQNKGSERLVIYSLNHMIITSFPFDILLNNFEDS